MLKLLVLAILLTASPANGLLETLLRTEDSCYAGCHTSYPINVAQLEACKKGCDLKLFKGTDCANQCKLHTKDDDGLRCCQIGCTLSRAGEEVAPEKSAIAVDPIPEIPKPLILPINPETGRPRSIILIRLRSRPQMDASPFQRFFNGDPAQMFNSMIKQFQENANNFDQMIRQSFEQNSKDLPKMPELKSISELIKTIPVNPLPANVRPDSSEESSEESNNKRPLIGHAGHIFQHHGDHHQFARQHMQQPRGRLHQFVHNVREGWNELIRRQPRIPVWILVGILLSSSAILWYMVMSLCRHTPSHSTLSIRAQELVFQPYEYDAYEKEKIQPDDQPYQVTESLPIKVKLSNI